jgi:hypothetical protein
MQRTTQSAQPTKATAKAYLGRPPINIALLAGVSGRMRVDVKGSPVASIDVQNGQVSVIDRVDEPTVVAGVDDPADFQRIVHGELNPVVAAIQGRLMLQGDLEFGVEVILALNAARPYAADAAAPSTSKGEG